MRKTHIIAGAVAAIVVTAGVATTAPRGFEAGRRSGDHVMRGASLHRQDPGVARRGRFAPHRIRVYFTREASLDDTCARVLSFRRRTTGADVLHDAMSQLLRGPRARERDAGATSPFSRHTAGMLNSVRISDGTAYVDFDDLRRLIPGASASCGSASLLAEIKKTAKQFATVDRVVLSLEGSKRAFYHWLQMEPPAQ